MEDKHLFDRVKGTCIDGMVCRKPEGRNETSSLFTVTCCFGFAIQFLQQLVDDLKLEVDLYLVEDGHYGAITHEGKWNGQWKSLKSI